jgi:hypothetical protein
LPSGAPDVVAPQERPRAAVDRARAAPLRQNPGDIDSDSSDAVGSRGGGPTPKERYIVAA